MKRSVVYGIIVTLVFSIVGSACAKNPKVRPQSSAERMRFIREHGLDKLPPTDIPIEVNERVIAWMDYFAGSGSRHFSRYLTRSGRYKEQMQAILKKYGLPKDLFYVALIESGFNMHARSHASAVGPWQFISGTGKRYGLRIDSWVDERRDPVKSTHAAARYLRDLYREFGDWYLAMAGYNAGEGRVRKAVANSGSKNFWVHADPKGNHLRPETRDYVPKYIAAAIMAKMPEDFGFTNIDYDKPFEYEIVTIPSQTDLEVVAKCADVKRYDIEELNPEIKLSATPPGVVDYKLRLPKGKKDKFLVAYAKVPKDDRIKLVIHRVTHKEKLATVARQYGVSSRQLASANGISSKAHLRVGQELIIPVGAAYKFRVAKGEDEGGSKTVKNKITYRVRPGDSLGKVARKYGVTTTQISHWNKLNRKGTIRVGQSLAIYKTKRVSVAQKDGGSKSAPSGSGGSTHTLKSGQTLGHVAEMYGVSTKDLMRWNNIKDPTRVRAGKKLVVKGGAAKEASSAAAASPEPFTAPVETKTVASKSEATKMKDLALAPEESVTEPSLNIEPPASAAKPAEKTDAPKKTAATETSQTYKIKSGDSLWTIARKHGCSVSDIKKWNALGESSKIKPGQKIVIKNM